MDGITRTLIGFFHFVHPVPILLTTLNLCGQGVIRIRHAALCPVPEDFADRQEERPQAEGDPNQLTERQREEGMAQLVLGLRILCVLPTAYKCAILTVLSNFLL